MKILYRIWTGIVAAIAGASLALVVQIAGMMTMGLPVEYLMGMVSAFAGIGFVLGVIVGPRREKSPRRYQKTTTVLDNPR